MNKYFNQKGLTLVELLAVIILITIISVFLFNLIIKGMENTDNITLDTQLRDEADIVVSKFLKKIYSIHQEDIIYNTSDMNGSYLQITKDRSKCIRTPEGNIENPSQCASTLYNIGFEKDAVDGAYILRLGENEVYKPQAQIRIKESSKIIGNPSETNVYELMLELSISKKRGAETQEKTMVFTNSVSPITK